MLTLTHTLCAVLVVSVICLIGVNCVCWSFSLVITWSVFFLTVPFVPAGYQVCVWPQHSRFLYQRLVSSLRPQGEQNTLFEVSREIYGSIKSSLNTHYCPSAAHHIYEHIWVYFGHNINSSPVKIKQGLNEPLSMPLHCNWYMHTSDCTLVKFKLMRRACKQCIISLMKYITKVELFAVINISFSINKKLFQVLSFFSRSSGIKNQDQVESFCKFWG